MVQNLSPRAVWLYLMRFDDLWACQPARRPHPASLPVPVPAVEFATRFFERRAHWRFRLRFSSFAASSAPVPDKP